MTKGTARVTCFRCQRVFDVKGGTGSVAGVFTPDADKIVCPGCGETSNTVKVDTPAFDAVFTADAPPAS